MQQQAAELLRFPNRQEWLEARNKGIGSSDCASVLGYGYAPAVKVWGEKTGKLEPEDLSKNPRVQAGIRLEKVVAEIYRDETGNKTENYGTHVWRNKQSPYMQASLDRGIISKQHKSTGVLEVKTTGGWGWDDGPPISVLIQIQHQFVVTGRTWGAVACLKGGYDFSIHEVNYNPDFGEMIMEKCSLFWKQVLHDVQPPPDASEESTKTLLRLFKKEEVQSCILPGEAMIWTDEYEELTQQIKELKARKTALKNKLINEIADAEMGFLPDGTAWTLKTTNVGEQVKKAYSFRALRRKLK